MVHLVTLKFPGDRGNDLLYTLYPNYSRLFTYSITNVWSRLIFLKMISRTLAGYGAHAVFFNRIYNPIVLQDWHFYFLEE
jgi:hypothetical protein